MPVSPIPNDPVPADAYPEARRATASLLDLLQRKRARISFRYERRYMITPTDSDDPMIFLTLDSDVSLPGDAIVITERGEFGLTFEEMRAITDALLDEESTGWPVDASLPNQPQNRRKG
jgi:hypothetical protein